MNLKSTKGGKRNIRQETRLTRPPRLESKVKEAMMQPVRKKKRLHTEVSGGVKKIQGYTEKQRKDYHLKSKRR